MSTTCADLDQIAITPPGEVAGQTGHPIIRSAEPGETWCWFYVDEVQLEIEFE